MSIDAKDLVRVINACRKSGVSQLKLGSLEIKFGPGDADQTKVQAGEAAQTPTDQELKEVEELVRENDILDRADDELALMQVENPALFEELLVNRELEARETSGEESVFD